MSRIPCPHCGQPNVKAATYCVLCQRPLVPPASPTGAPLREYAYGAGDETPALDVVSTPPHLTQNAVALARRGKEGVLPAAPLPPEPQAAKPAPLPIVVSPVLGKPPRQGDKDKPLPEVGERAWMAVVSPWRLAWAWAVDLAALMLVVYLWSGIELLSAPNLWPADAGSVLEQLASLVSDHPASAWRTLGVSLLAGLSLMFVGTLYGQTPGRFLTKTTLVRVSGQPCTWQVAVARELAGLLSIAAFGAGFFWCVVDSKSRTWHDLFSGTVVVSRRRSPAPH